MNIGLKGSWKRTKGCRLRHRISELRWDIKYAWRRAWKGYDARDVFAMNDMFVDRYKEILKDYKECHHCLFNVPKEYKGMLNNDYFNEEETDIIIDMMIYHLEMMNEDYVERLLYGKNIYDDDYDWSKDFNIEKYQRIASIVSQNKNLFMELFRVFFWELWD